MTRLVLCTIRIICLICHRHRRVQACCVSVMFVSCPAARFHATSRTVCICVYAYMTRYVCGSAGTSRQRGTSTHYMHAAARALHSQGSAALSVFYALYACGSAGTSTLSPSRQRGTFSLSRTTCMRQRALHSSTLKAARRHLGMSVCRRRWSAGLHARWSLLESVRVCWSLR